MNRIKQLLTKLCPGGVEYKPLGEVATDVFRGSGILRTQVTETGVPCVRYGEIYTTYGIWFDECVSHTKEEYIQSPKYFEHGDILFAITGESVEEIAKSTAYIGHERCLAGGDIVVLKHNQDPKYLSYALSTVDAQSQKSKGKVKSKVVHSSVPAIKEIVIPLPPIEIQREVVEVLDKFALLEAELEAELAKRKKQYEHYRRALLAGSRNEELGIRNGGGDSAANWPRVKLGEVCEILRGKRLTKSQLANDFNIPVFHGGLEPLGMYSQANRHANMTMVINVGASAGTVGYSTVPFWSSDGCYSLEPNERLSSRYLFHALVCQEINIKSRVRVAGIPTLDKSAVAEVSIPLPPLDEQQRIVAILDRFDALCNSLSEGLPAEIERRKKQYAYYRDRLLAFPKKGAA